MATEQPKKSQIVSPTVQISRDIFAGNSKGNSYLYFIQSFMQGRINTAIPVIVLAVYNDGISPTGRVDVKPLVCPMDAENNVIETAPLYRLPYTRIQGGTAAIICDPVVGDIGIAVFAKQDISNIDNGIKEPLQAGSFRTYDVSDGMYIGGILNQTPTCYVQVLPDGNINITAPAQVTINTGTAVVNASETTVNGHATFNGDVQLNGKLDVRDNAVIKGISFTEHVHGGVDRGSSNTDTPH